jgi:hypothetical protein
MHRRWAIKLLLASNDGLRRRTGGTEDDDYHGSTALAGGESITIIPDQHDKQAADSQVTNNSNSQTNQISNFKQAHSQTIDAISDIQTNDAISHGQTNDTYSDIGTDA